ncbi:MAG: aspartyl protease family protein, partial [Chitinophagaceae bacterium]
KPLLASIPIQGGRIREQDKEIAGRFYFDTGAGLCLLLSQDFQTDSVKFSPRKKMHNTQAEGLGGKAKMKITTVKEFRLGPYRFKKVPAYIFDDDYNVTSYPYLGGLIGNDLLRRFNIILNYEKRDIHIIPNSHYRDPFDYAYTGLGFYFSDGEIRVTDIMQGSPAEKAGFKVDDIIMAIDNNFSGNVQIYKNLLQNQGARLRILIMREGLPVMVNMKVRSIL